MDGMTIGRLAREAGVHVETVRYYERRRLLERPPEPSSGYRIYSRKAIRRIRFIKRAQELGFSLREIAELLSLRAEPRRRCADVQARAEAKIGEIEGKIHTLGSMKKALGKLVQECAGRQSVTECPILEALDPLAAGTTDPAGKPQDLK